MTVISNRPDDVEINLNMEPGQHEISLEFLGKGQEDILSWHWISRDQEYFHVVPEEILGSF